MRMDTVARVIRASPGAVYGALLGAEARGVWLAPKGMVARFERFEARVGGGYRMVLTYDQPKGAKAKSSHDSDVVEARFLELVPNERVVEAVDFESDDAAFTGTMTMTWALAPVPSGTEVRVTAENVPAGISPEDHQAGMGSSLENLAVFVGSSESG